MIYKFKEFILLNESVKTFTKSQFLADFVKKYPKLYALQSTIHKIWQLEEKPLDDIINDMKQFVLNDRKYDSITDFNIVAPNKSGRNKSRFSRKWPTIEFILNGVDMYVTINTQKISGGPTTEEQENCSIFMFKKVLQTKDGNVSNYIDYISETYFDRIELHPDWISSLQLQTNAIANYIDNGGFDASKYKFFRTGETKAIGELDKDTFTNALYKKAKELIGFSSKDSWNPADVWIIRDINKHINIINNFETYQELNSYLVDCLQDKTIFPISLKKVEGSASLDELNMNENRNNVIQKPKLINLSLDFDFKNKKFKNNGFRITTEENIIFVGRFSQRTQYSIEAAQRGGKAQLGKVPVAFYRKSFGKEFTKKEWIKLSLDGFNEDYLRLIFDEVIKNKNKYNSAFNIQISDDNSKVDVNTFIEGMKVLFDDPKLINRFYEKAISLDIIYNILKDSTLDDIYKTFGKFAMAAQKLTEDAGPFIKIY